MKIQEKNIGYQNLFSKIPTGSIIYRLILQSQPKIVVTLNKQIHSQCPPPHTHSFKVVHGQTMQWEPSLIRWGREGIRDGPTTAFYWLVANHNNCCTCYIVYFRGDITPFASSIHETFKDNPWKPQWHWFWGRRLVSSSQQSFTSEDTFRWLIQTFWREDKEVYIVNKYWFVL